MGIPITGLSISNPKLIPRDSEIQAAGSSIRATGLRKMAANPILPATLKVIMETLRPVKNAKRKGSTPVKPET